MEATAVCQGRAAKLVHLPLICSRAGIEFCVAIMNNDGIRGNECIGLQVCDSSELVSSNRERVNRYA